MQLLALLSLLPLAFAQSSASYASSASGSASSTASSASASASATQIVHVAQFGLRYTDEVITAPKGGKVVFKFTSGAHSVTQGNFDTPCQPAANGFNSGFVRIVNQTFTVDITSTDPIFFYCAQGSHCQSGMVGVINPAPNSQQQLSVYRNNAASAGNSSIPASVRGGQLSGSTSTSGNNSTNTTTGSGSGSASGSATPTKTGDAIKQSAGWIIALFAAVLASVVSV